MSCWNNLEELSLEGCGLDENTPIALENALIQVFNQTLINIRDVSENGLEEMIPHLRIQNLNLGSNPNMGSKSAAFFFKTIFNYAGQNLQVLGISNSDSNFLEGLAEGLDEYMESEG
jgi:hypothetical protein